MLLSAQFNWRDGGPLRPGVRPGSRRLHPSQQCVCVCAPEAEKTPVRTAGCSELKWSDHSSLGLTRARALLCSRKLRRSVITARVLRTHRTWKEPCRRSHNWTCV